MLVCFTRTRARKHAYAFIKNQMRKHAVGI